MGRALWRRRRHHDARARLLAGLVERGGRGAGDDSLAGGACYELGSEVLAQLSGRAETEPGRVDLRQVLVEQGRALGLGEISTSGWCSAHDREHFFSHRASGGRDGRMIAYVGLPSTAA